MTEVADHLNTPVEELAAPVFIPSPDVLIICTMATGVSVFCSSKQLQSEAGNPFLVLVQFHEEPDLGNNFICLEGGAGITRGYDDVQ